MILDKEYLFIVSTLSTRYSAQRQALHSRSALLVEHDEGNPTLKSLNAVFKPFGLQMGVVRRPRKF
ncbi:UNVERIFIED_ORG: hypothetical protein EDF86_2638 [Pseudomonas psychrophila]